MPVMCQAFRPLNDVYSAPHGQGTRFERPYEASVSRSARLLSRNLRSKDGMTMLFSRRLIIIRRNRTLSLRVVAPIIFQEKSCKSSL